MPLFRHSVTGNEDVLTQEYADAFPEGTWEKVADEAPDEKAARELREREQRTIEAISNKVELVEDDSTDTGKEGA